jgi:hypothetical protein
VDTNDESVGYAANIKPLFRELDRNSMLKVFDLWNYDDVVSNQDAILGHLVAGSMPCDGPWPETNIALVRRWIDDGSRP